MPFNFNKANAHRPQRNLSKLQREEKKNCKQEFWTTDTKFKVKSQGWIMSLLVCGLTLQKRFSANITEASYVPRQSILDNLKFGPLSSRWSWSSNTLATWCKVLTHWKDPWWWEGLKAKGEEGDRRWALPTQWTWVWANSRRQWRTGKAGMLQFMGSQRVRHGSATEQQHQPFQLFPKLWVLLHRFLCVTQPCSKDLDQAPIHAKTEGGWSLLQI